MENRKKEDLTDRRFLAIGKSFLILIISIAGSLGIEIDAKSSTDTNNQKCDSCQFYISNLDEVFQLKGHWLFTRDDNPENKEVEITTDHWKLANTPGPWTKIYND
ncbi:MAG: hypothetical protein CMP10_12530, partial [Zetaproteobacteria bacterium]|nr:hypothetical protein [Pseudobdellovibrionaceae bacterium]